MSKTCFLCLKCLSFLNDRSGPLENDPAPIVRWKDGSHACTNVSDYSIYLSHLHSSLDLMRVVSCRNGFEVHALLLIID